MFIQMVVLGDNHLMNMFEAIADLRDLLGKKASGMTPRAV